MNKEISDKKILETLKNLIGINYRVEFYNNHIRATPIELDIRRQPTAEELEILRKWFDEQRMEEWLDDK